MSSENIINLTKASFNEQVLDSNIPVLVDFWAAWCGPCKMIAPVIDKIADAYLGRLKVCKVNVDDEGILSSDYMVMSIPTLIFFKDGEIVNKLVGVKTQKELTDYIETII